MLTVNLQATTESKIVLQKLLQHIQDFNVFHNDAVHFEITVDLPTFTPEETEELLDSLVPKLPYKAVFKKVGEA
jgi:hypothetical protein